MDRYPYFLYPLLTEYEKCSDKELAGELRGRIAANIGDMGVLVSLIGEQDKELRNFYPDQKPPKTTTEDTIDAFIAKFSRPGENMPDAPLLQPSAPTDYFAAQKQQPRKPSAPAVPEAKSPQTRKRKSPPPRNTAAPVSVAPEVKKVDTAAVMAEVKKLVKNREYERALEIMNDFYLNNPKKSVYFADQIRFVNKMMLNEVKKVQK